MLTISLILAVLGLALGSFVNALVFRLHMQAENRQPARTKNLSIVSGRSICPNCGHELAWYDLVPLVSWITLRGKCRYCKKTISIQYPLVELVMAVVFVGSYLFWPQAVHQNGQWLVLSTWLAVFVGLLALAVYDLRWMLLPNKVIYPALAVAAAGRIAYIIAYEPRKWHSLALWIGSLIVASGVFWILYVTSKGKWIGFGDVRLGLITGTLLADPYNALLMVFLASLIGSLAAAPSLIKRQKTLASRLPYGPFLITATVICVVFGQPIIDWYKRLYNL